MTVPRYLFVLVSVLALSGCQSLPGEKLDPSDLEYAGPIQQFTVPYLLRYESTDDVTFAVTLVGKGLDDERYDQFAKSRHKISRIGEQRLWEISVEEIKEKGQITRSSAPPLVSMRMLLPPQGPVEQVDIDFPAYRASGAKDIPDRNSSIYKELESTAKRSGPRLPEMAVRIGDEPYSHVDMLADILTSAGHADLSARIGEVLRSNTLSDVKSALIASRVFELKMIVRDKGTVKAGEWHGTVNTTF